MARLGIWLIALIGLVFVVLVSAEPACAQDPGGGGGRPGGGRPGGGRGGDRGREMSEEMQKEIDKAAYDAATKAAAQGKSQEEIEEAARKAADEVIDKRTDEMVERMGQGRGGNRPGGGGNAPGGGGNPPGGGPPGGGGFDPEQMKERFKERAREQAASAVKSAADRAVEDYRTKSWKEITPADGLAGEEVEDKDIEEKIRETTLFEEFKDTADKALDDLKLTKPVILFIFATYDGTKTTERKVERCNELRENVFGSEDFLAVCGDFVRLQVDLKDLRKPLREKYKVASAPTVVFLDCTGKRLWSFTNPKESTKNLLKKMETFVTKSEEAKEKAQQEGEKTDKDEEKKDTDKEKEAEPQKEEGEES
jgi:hypothetical protein